MSARRATPAPARPVWLTRGEAVDHDLGDKWDISENLAPDLALSVARVLAFNAGVHRISHLDWAREILRTVGAPEEALGLEDA